MTERRFLGRQEITADVRRIQAMFGTLYAGGGVVILDSTGIAILVGAAYADLRSYRFVNAAGTTVSRVGSRQDATDSEIVVEAHPFAGRNSATYVRADSPAGQISQVGIEATHGVANSAGVLFDISAANASTIEWQLDGGWQGGVTPGHWWLGLAADAVSGNDVRLQADWEVTYIVSLREGKDNIVPWQADRNQFMRLQPSSYTSIKKPEHGPIIGLIAEDVEQVAPYLANYLAQKGPDGKPDMNDLRLSGYDDKQLLITLVSVVQEQQKDIEALKARVTALEAK